MRMPYYLKNSQRRKRAKEQVLNGKTSLSDPFLTLTLIYVLYLLNSNHCIRIFSLMNFYFYQSIDFLESPFPIHVILPIPLIYLLPNNRD